MAQDLRELLKGANPEDTKLSRGHENRFEAMLEKELPIEKDFFSWTKVAAIAVVLISITFFGYQYLSNFSGDNTIKTNNPIVKVEDETTPDENQITLGDLSPDLKKVEEYYLAGINVQLASLKIDDKNKELVESYMKQLSALDKEYKNLSLELNTVGPTEETITALIDNLKLRLELLFKLKSKLNELKTQENEPINNI